MRARYGLNLRKFIKRFDLEQLVDFGELKVFADAATFPLIVIAAKPAAAGQGPRPKPVYAAIKDLPRAPSPAGDRSGWLATAVRTRGFELEDAALSDAGFTLVRRDAQRILEKMRAAGVPLGEYVGGRIYRGVLTGFNKAFVIDRAKRDELIAADPNSAEIIKPFVVGDDVRRYYIDFKERYLILTKIGVNIKRYPAVFEHLKRYEKTLKKRWDKGPHWWELRACDYYAEFEKPKIVWPVIAKETRFSLDSQNLYFDCSCFIIPFGNKYILGLLNSKLIWEWLKRACYILGDPDKAGRLQLKRQWLKDIPIPSLAPEDTRRLEIEELVTRILGLSATPESRAQNEIEIAVLSQKIDELVYELYGLTPEEIKIVEGT